MAEALKIDWNADESHVLVNPRYSTEELECFNELLDETANFPAHIWVATSGSRSAKWVGLSKKALLVSAEAVNLHLDVKNQDSWIHALPEFHVGGLGIRARSYISGNDIFDYKSCCGDKWDAPQFYQFVTTVRGTLAALVPAQLYDIVHLNIASPSSLRAVIIGGGYLSPALYRQAVDLGWKVLPSYGMTECGSQVATADLGSWEGLGYPSFKILSHMDVRIEDDSLKVKSPSLLSSYAVVSPNGWKLMDPKIDGWFQSEDRGVLEGDNLTILGRKDSVIKIGGESVDLLKLENLLEEIRIRENCLIDMALVDVADERLGKVLNLVSEKCNERSVQSVVAAFQRQVLPFEKIRRVHYVTAIPRSPLHKVLKGELLRMIL